MPKPFEDSLLIRPVRFLGKGGMGEVYEAVVEGVEDFARTVALKVIRPDAATRPEFLRLFVGEARLAARLSHPNIIQVYHFGRSSETYYLLMEYVRGMDLGEFIERHRSVGRPVEPSVACRIMKRVLSALDYAVNLQLASGERLGLIHRDVCPSNIMVSLEGGVKVGDFGIAQAFHAVGGMPWDSATRYMGRPEYLAPEVLEGAVPTPASDVFSAGVTLYVMLTLRQPFLHSDTSRTIENVRFGPVASPADLVKGIPERLAEVTLTALEKSPENRYQDAFQFLEALSNAVQDEAETWEDAGPGEASLGRYMRELLHRSESPKRE